MLFASLFTSALAVIGSASAAPLTSGTDVQVRERSVDTLAGAAIAHIPRAQSNELQSFVNRLENNPAENDEAYVTRVMNACMDRWPDHNIFIFHRHKGFTWGADNMDAAMEATAEHNYPFKAEYFGVVVFKTAGWLQKNGDGGYGNWRFAGDFAYDGDSKVVFRARP